MTNCIWVNEREDKQKIAALCIRNSFVTTDCKSLILFSLLLFLLFLVDHYVYRVIVRVGKQVQLHPPILKNVYLQLIFDFRLSLKTGLKEKISPIYIE